VQISQALNPRRIARTLASILVLTFIQSVVPVVVAPIVSAPQAKAVTGTSTASVGGSGSTIQIPSGVFSVTFTVVGGAGGKGGDDGNSGKNGTVAGRTIITVAVTPGDVIGLYPGNAGTAAGACASAAPGGAGGSDNFPGGAYSINGTYFQGMDFSGGPGGNAGAGGCSGAGGGAGAASIATVNSEIVAIAGGAGGGGGTGSGNNYAADWGGTLIPNGTFFRGETGTSTVTCTGSNQNSDGGGGGGGGGGYYGGKGGLAPMIVAECAGISGSPGGNFVSSRATNVTNDRISQTATGYVTYDYNVEATTACSKTTTTVDIYTVETVTYTGNCTWTVPSTVNVIDFFIVGGGGGGGGDGGSGGGGGAALLRTAIAVTPNSNVTLKAGGGGAGGSWGYSWGPIAGEATTITLASGTIFSANGGSAGTSGPNSDSATGGVAINGGFAGGRGGTSPACFNVGGPGQTGTSNYFLGTVRTYGGGGGGGACPNSAATTPASGANGGGAGGYAVSSSLNAPGGNATSGTGSGGGGGLATGSGLKINGGKGGSGIIFIRYATSSSDAFPAALASSLAGRWTAEGLQVIDSGRKGWIDSSGTYATVSVTGSPTVYTQGTTDGGFTVGSTRSNLVAAGGTGDRATFVAGTLSNYTMLHVARYARGGSQGRVITASGGNFISGQYSSTIDGAAHHNNAWLTPTNYPTAYKWLLSTDQAQLYRANGKDIAYNVDSSNASGASGPTGLGINNYTSEPSTWQMTEVILFNRQLTAGEMRLMESYMALMYGLTLDSDAVSSETDTAYVGNGNYYYGQYGQYYLNDTFTIEMWLKPTSTCDTTECAIYSRENMLVTRIYAGTFWYALYGASYGWQWTDTGVKVKSGEWHHIALSKRSAANTNGSLDVYIDGQLAFTKAGDPYYAATTATTFNAAYTVNQSNIWSYIGARAVDGSPRFYGALDEVKIWKVARTGSQIAADMHSNDATSSNLQIYYDFNRNQLSSTANISNLAIGGGPRTDLIAATTITYEDVKVTSTLGPYTTITFPRTYITQSGGWKVPSTVTTATTIVVGGGGGAGKSVSNQAYPAGAGGGGGVTYSPTQSYTPGATVQVTVGVGGVGATAAADDASIRNGTSSYLGVQSGITALGGGGGGSNSYPGAGGSSVATGGGGGGSTTSGSCAALGSVGGTVPSGYNGARGGWGWGGLGGSARGAATTSGCYGIAADGFIDSVTTVVTEYGRTGSNEFHSTWSVNANYTRTNNGWGGSVSYGGTAVASGAGISGSAGVVVIRYITALKPTYSPPTNAYLNVGMTETFTTNVAQDSATAMLTRTFRWESTTAGSGGTFTPIKIGTGATNAAFSWVPTDTSTSGSQYLYRVVVTDSDTAGLFIQDTSTAVFATINPALRFTSTSTSIKKTLNLAQSETFTISLGTPNYRYALSPVLPGVTIETNTAGVAVLKIAETATVGTYIETLTVTDSVSATLSIPITLNISAPPSLTAIGEVVKNYQVLHLDASNRWSLQGVDGVATNGLIWKDQSGTKRDALTNNASAINSTSCKAPVFTTDNGGAFNFNGTDTCYYTPYLGSQFQSGYTIETWIKPTSNSIPSGTQVLSQMYDTAGEQISLVIGALDVGNGNIYVGFFSGNGWRYVNIPITPVANTWMHIAGTYDGNTLRTYLNGALVGSTTYTYYGSLNSKGYFIGKRWDGGYFYTGAIAEVRAYSVPLSDTQVVQNFNATRYRFDSTNLSLLKPSQKYGTITLESFTVTAGGDTKTVAFALGNRSGITWDTTTVTGQIRLSVQESLTPGTYYDTITVTDNFAQSTNLPIRFTVSKADTLTIYVDTPTALNYTGANAIFTPTVKGIGAVGLESGTALSATMRFKPAGTTCATGGYCRVGDLGPGGGIVFIDT
jgi:hypothetical protein